MRRSEGGRRLTAQFYRGNLGCLCVAGAAALASGLLNLILSWMIQQLIDAASGAPEALPLPVLSAMAGGFVALCAGILWLRYCSEPHFIERAMRQYKELAFRRLTEKNIASFRDESTAVYLSALTNDAGRVESEYLEQQLSLLTKAVTFVGALALMLWYSPLLTAVAACVTALPLAASLLTGGRLQAAEQRVSDRNRDFTAALTDCLGGFSVVKVFKAEREIFRLFSESNRALEHEKFLRRRLKLLVGMIGSVTGIFAQLGVFLAGAWMALGGYGLTAGAVILFVNLMNFLIEPVAELPSLLASRKAALGLTEKLAESLEHHAAAATGQLALPPLRQDIVLDNVSFGYSEEREVLHGISAVLRAGGAYAVVGGSGSGKSTLLSLLTAGSTAYRGNIRLDGRELRDIAPEALYEQITVIQQNVFVFHATVRENVTMFREFPRERVASAMKRAHLDALLAERGEEYLCGENGSGLSGGEKQRISIARSLLKQSSVLLADEATAALDAETAHRVSAELLDLSEMTRIVVTHSLEEALLRRCDGILVLKDGRLAEMGRFDELMENKGYFYALYTVSQ